MSALLGDETPAGTVAAGASLTDADRVASARQRRMGRAIRPPGGCHQTSRSCARFFGAIPRTSARAGSRGFAVV